MKARLALARSFLRRTDGRAAGITSKVVQNISGISRLETSRLWRW